MTSRVTKKSDMDVLDPQPVDHVIHGRTFTQEPLSIASFGNITAVIFQLISMAGASDVLGRLGEIDLNTAEGKAAALPALLGLLNLAPVLLPRALGAMLGIKEEEDIEYIGQYCRPATMLKIISTFIDQNEPEELFAAFLALKDQMGRMANLTKSN